MGWANSYLVLLGYSDESVAIISNPILFAGSVGAGSAMQEASRRVGAEIAKICLEKGITKVAFDRGGFIYHGRIKALAEGAREAGLEF